MSPTKAKKRFNQISFLKLFFSILKIVSFCSKRIYKIYDFIFIYFDIFGKKIFENQIRTTWAEERTVKIIEKIGLFYLKLFMEILYKSLWWVDKEILFLFGLGRSFQFLIYHNLPHFYRLIYRGLPRTPNCSLIGYI